jgi:hypothetical protein
MKYFGINNGLFKIKTSGESSISEGPQFLRFLRIMPVMISFLMPLKKASENNKTATFVV